MPSTKMFKYQHSNTHKFRNFHPPTHCKQCTYLDITKSPLILSTSKSPRTFSTPKSPLIFSILY